VEVEAIDGLVLEGLEAISMLGYNSDMSRFAVGTY
jgi:hypothetical protein